MELKEAISILKQNLKEDNEYKTTWVANIACAAMDEKIDHTTANKIAERFVSNLINYN